jgi:hypothetical protein
MLGALELVVAHVVAWPLWVSRSRPQPTRGQQPGEQLLDRAVDGGDLVGETVGWAITWRRMTRRLRTHEPVEPIERRETALIPMPRKVSIVLTRLCLAWDGPVVCGPVPSSLDAGS